MALKKPKDGETVWIEFPEGRHFPARYDAAHDRFDVDGADSIDAGAIANWSYNEHDDHDISDDPKEAIKGRITRD
jgi:hypothetical protein